MLLLLILFSFSVSLVGCSRLSFLPDQNGDGNPTDDTPQNEIPAITPADPPPQIYYNRYTGLACDEALLSCRPISVCIGNFDGTRQEGLSFADILAEAPIDGDKTRLWAITTNPAAASSLSSVSTVRDYMMPIVGAFGAIGAYAGTTDTVGATATPHAGDNLDYQYHNLFSTFSKDEAGGLYTSGPALLSAAASRGYSTTDKGQALPYRLTEPNAAYTPNSNRIRSISFRYSMANTIAFRYAEETGLYLREQSGTAHTDPLTGEQLSFSNVILLFHNVSYYHTSTETTFSLDTEDGGDGYCYTGGGVISVHWSYKEDGTLSILDDDGNPITLNRGKTYIGLLRVTDSTSLIAK